MTNDEQSPKRLKLATLALDDCLLLYEQHLRTCSPNQAQTDLAQLSTAIDRFTLPGWGFTPFQGNRPTKAEQQAAQHFRRTISLAQLEGALEAQAKGFGLLKPSAASQKVYKSVLQKFLHWYHQQDQRLMQAGRLASTKFRRGHGHFNTKCLTTKRLLPPYRLRLDEMPSSLVEEIERLYEFWTQPTGKNRVPKRLRQDVAKNYQDWVRGLLGWLYRYEKRPLDALKLSALVPMPTLQGSDDPAVAKRAAREVAEQVNDLGSRYIKWLVAAPPAGRGCQSPKTKAMVWSTLSFVARYQYNDETDSAIYGKSYQDIPVVQNLRVEIHKLKAAIRQHEGISDESKSWLDWETVLQLTEQLRQECAPVTFYKDLSRKLGVRGRPRPDMAISGSFQLYILFAMLTYIPPRRIGELQRLKLGRRKHPSFDARYPYLDKQEGIWIIDVPPLASKTGNTYGHQKLKLPNVVFEDGKSFYSYLEEWLDTWRQVYQPQHAFVFSTKAGQPMSRHNLCASFRTAAHRLTGQSLGPHKLRDICATYYLDHEYSNAVINALAEMMAHDPKILKEHYDRRKGWQKNRPIEQAIKVLLERLFDCTVR